MLNVDEGIFRPGFELRVYLGETSWCDVVRSYDNLYWRHRQPSLVYQWLKHPLACRPVACNYIR